MTGICLVFSSDGTLRDASSDDTTRYSSPNQLKRYLSSPISCPVPFKKTIEQRSLKEQRLREHQRLFALFNTYVEKPKTEEIKNLQHNDGRTYISTEGESIPPNIKVVSTQKIGDALARLQIASQTKR